MGRYSVPRPAKAERNWQVYRARRVEKKSFREVSREFGVCLKRVGNILEWCDRQQEQRNAQEEE